MEKEQQILNWLMAGISKFPGQINEIFYFERSKQEFFSILWTDHMLMEEHKGMTFSYSKDSAEALRERIIRIENNDPDIIGIPGLNSVEREELLDQFLESLNNPELSSHIKNENLDKKWSKFKSQLELQAPVQVIEQWNEFKYPMLRDRAESFLNLNGIHIDGVQLLEIEEDGNVKFDLTVDDDPEPRKRWWRFWGSGG